VKAENGYYRWRKGDRIKINEFFSTHEFSCQCEHVDCVEQKISEDLIERLSSLRKSKNTSITITSGFRCKKHQEDIRNSGVSTVVAKVSQHELGNGADVKLKGLSVEEWLEDAKKLFSYIGIAKTFLHVDTRPAKVQGTHVTWKY
jgi:uncharacterized protein YcbK (DUF882 family)